MSESKQVIINVNLDGFATIEKKPDDIEVLITYEEDDFDPLSEPDFLDDGFPDDYDEEDEDDEDDDDYPLKEEESGA